MTRGEGNKEQTRLRLLQHYYEVLCGELYVVTQTASGRLVYTRDNDFDYVQYFFARQ